LVYALPFPAGFCFSDSKIIFMDMLIHGNRLLRELQEEFQAYYPYLKMIFLWKKSPDDKYEILPEASEPFIRIADISRENLQGFISIDDNTRLNQLMNLFKAEFDISVNFLHFTKAGWVSACDIMEAMIKELNEQGRICFHSIHNVYVKPDHLL
jgi:hypothetical protein